jgi:hypothetical protein
VQQATIANSNCGGGLVRRKRGSSSRMPSSRCAAVGHTRRTRFSRRLTSRGARPFEENRTRKESLNVLSNACTRY